MKKLALLLALPLAACATEVHGPTNPPTPIDSARYLAVAVSIETAAQLRCPMSRLAFTALIATRTTFDFRYGIYLTPEQSTSLNNIRATTDRNCTPVPAPVAPPPPMPGPERG